MEATIGELENALATLGKDPPWGADLKVTDDFLDPLFAKFSSRLGLPHLMNKSDYHELARFVPANRMDPEVATVLDQILRVASAARPIGERE
jgi:hypothetical protein